MTAQIPESQVQTETKPNDKELNFRALEAKYQRELAQERAAREEAERALQERSKAVLHEDDDDDDEPYVDKKKLEKKLARFGEAAKKETKNEIQSAVNQALREERKQNWVKANPDFYEVLQHAEKIVQKDPELAETILEMPEGFERQKLVYKQIKALGLHKPEEKTPSIQEKVDANRRGPYYQPSGVGAAPYASAGDFSASGQKNAYDKMQELKARLRL
jgi:hypothetical protein